MKLSSKEQESIIALLTRIYIDIVDIETEYALFAGEGDFRPRIDYFHDAIRALSAKDSKAFEAGERLSVEYLAYDLSCLRFIQEMPVAPFKPNGQMLSAHTDMVKVEKHVLHKTKRPDRALRERISELYKNYAVLFAALLKPQADADYHARVDHLNKDVEDINSVINALQSSMSQKTVPPLLTSAIHNLDDEGLRQALLLFIQKKKFSKSDDTKKAVHQLTEQIGKKDKLIATIELAHMNYALAQLAIFENSRDMLKKMATQGMNLVGQFVEASVAQARREFGR